MTTANGPTQQFRTARDFLLQHAQDYETAYEGFALAPARPVQLGPRLVRRHRGGQRAHGPAHRRGGRPRDHHLVRRDVRALGPGRELAARPGVGAGDRILLMLGSQQELWMTMLAAMKLRARRHPGDALLGSADLRDRIERGRAAHVIVRAEDAAKFDDVPGDYTRIAVKDTGADPVPGWLDFDDVFTSGTSAHFEPDGDTRADDALLSTSRPGRRLRPKLVEHTHVSYPVGHLATM